MVGLTPLRCVKIYHGIIVGQMNDGWSRFTAFHKDQPLETMGTQKFAYASICSNV